MDSLRFRRRMFEREHRGERLTDEEIGFITNKSTELAGVRPRESALNQDQLQWATKADQVLSKPVDKINRQDASDVSSKESRAFEMVPATGSVSSHVQSVAGRNEFRGS